MGTDNGLEKCVNKPTISHVDTQTVMLKTTEKSNPAHHMWVTHLFTDVNNHLSDLLVNHKLNGFTWNGSSLCVIGRLKTIRA